MIENMFQNIPQHLDDEFFDIIIQNKNFKLERIISKGHVTPPGEWYNQEQHEWVFLLKGAAQLKIAGQINNIELNPGDHLLLPAHKKHRVEWTDPNTETIWLALHFNSNT